MSIAGEIGLRLARREGQHATVGQAGQPGHGVEQEGPGRPGAPFRHGPQARLGRPRRKLRRQIEQIALDRHGSVPRTCLHLVETLLRHPQIADLVNRLAAQTDAVRERSQVSWRAR